jgi:tRNA (cmo5U34)-methyltransferase
VAGAGERAQWTEADSAAFVDHGDLFVPAREEQIAALVSLIPAGRDEAFTAVELGAGAGVLARAVLEAFPRCRYLALDGSETMRAQLARELSSFGARIEVGAFELGKRAWRHGLPRPLRCVLASLVVHHLPAAGKKRLFADLAGRLDPGGALLLADLVAPATPAAGALFADQWDAAVRERSLARTGSLEAFECFRRDGWNYYRLEAPEPYDQPSPLADQLLWLARAGFTRRDCFWMKAGHAVFGGYRGSSRRG